VLQLPLFRHPQDAFPDARQGDRTFPGGFGTLDETVRGADPDPDRPDEAVPILLFGEAFWRRIVNWEALAEAGTISDEDLELFRFVETAEEAVAAIDGWEGAGEKRDSINGRSARLKPRSAAPLVDTAAGQPDLAGLPCCQAIGGVAARVFLQKRWAGHAGPFETRVVAFAVIGIGRAVIAKIDARFGGGQIVSAAVLRQRQGAGLPGVAAIGGVMADIAVQ
jgi:hypothetical protein